MPDRTLRTANPQLEQLLDALHYAGPRPRRDYMCRCPAHDDDTPSLSVTATAEGKILLHCFAGCETRAVVAALGLTMRDLMPVDTRWTPARSPTRPSCAVAMRAKMMRHSGAPKTPPRKLGRIVAKYDYRDEAGRFVCQVVRFDPKAFRQRRWVQGKWVWNIAGVTPSLYRLPELLAADPAAWVFVVEGEKDVETLRQNGLVATCNIHGAGKWKSEYGRWLRGRKVCLLPDNDEAGRAHARGVAQNLQGIARAVTILALPNLPAKGDVSDWLANGGDAETLVGMANAGLTFIADTFKQFL